MKRYTRLLSLLLAMAMVLSMVACTGDTAPTETSGTPAATETTAPPEPSAADLYNAAKATLDAATDISLSVGMTTYTTVADNQFSERSTGTVTYRAIGTENAMIHSEEEISYGIHLEADEDAKPTTYTEIWSGGNMYAELDGTHRTTTPMDADAAMERYIPVTLLDAALYETVSTEAADGSTRIVFADATAGESWLIPEEAVLKEASGTALLSAEGNLTEMTYTADFVFGAAQYKIEVDAKPLAETKEVTVPADTSAYTAIEAADALYLYASVSQKLGQSSSYTLKSTDCIYSQAGAFSADVISNGTVLKTGDELMLKVDLETYDTDYAEQTQDAMSYEVTYRDGKATYVENGGLPSSVTIKPEDAKNLIPDTNLLENLSPEFWESATATYFGGLCLFEFTLNEKYGNNRHNDLCKSLFGSSTVLYDMASEYRTGELSGYFSVDLYTGLPVATGIVYEGFHTIDGDECLLSHQSDGSINLCDIGAYKTITEEMPETTEPESKPTPLFYKVTGDNGQQMWLLGTIHVGDQRTAHLPSEIRDAFAGSKALALEVNFEEFEKELESDKKLAEKVSKMYYLQGDDDLSTVLEQEDYEELIKLQKATGTYDAYSDAYTVAYTASSLSDVYMQIGHQLHGDWGVEEQLERWAKEQEKEIWGIETGLSHVELELSWSEDIQYMLLSDIVLTSPEEYREATSEMYEQWCAGDEAVIRESLNAEVDISELTEEEKAEYEKYKPHMDEYDKVMMYDRNEGMLKKAVEYLESGDVIFYAVGLAHLLEGDNCLVDALREAGYTVELVTYGA